MLGYLFVTVSFLRLRKSHPELERPYRVPAAKLVGTLALLATVFFICLYLPGSPSALPCQIHQPRNITGSIDHGRPPSLSNRARFSGVSSGVWNGR